MKRLVCGLVLILVSATVDAQETNRFLAGVASAPGANDTFWRTDARVFNPSAEQDISVHLSYLASNADNSGAVEVSMSVPPRQVLALDDMVDSVFGRTGAGGVRIRSDMPFLAAARTYNIGDGTSGTFGQFIPGLAAGDALVQGILLAVANDPAGAGSRSNVGFLNPSASTVTVAVKVFDAGAGTLVGEGELTLPPLAFSQINNVFGFVGEAAAVVANASVEFTASAPVLAYASVIDNTSGDAITVLPEADDGTPSAENNPPAGEIVIPAEDVTVAAGEVVELSATVSDPDGDEVTGMAWDFGDGITASGLAVNHIFSDPGTFVVTFTATDEHGLDDPTPDTRTVTVAAAGATLTEVQNEVFSTSCAFSGCHAGAAAAMGMDLSDGNAHGNTVGVAARQRPSLSRIEPGSVDDSYLWLKVTGQAGSLMPLGGPALGGDELELLRSWIEAGALDN